MHVLAANHSQLKFILHMCSVCQLDTCCLLYNVALSRTLIFVHVHVKTVVAATIKHLQCELHYSKP
jgi:hypothetical protein